MQKHIVALVIASGTTFNTEVEVEVPEDESFVMPVIDAVGSIVNAISENIQDDWELSQSDSPFSYNAFKDNFQGDVSVDVINDCQILINNNDGDIHIILTDFNG